MDACQGDSGGPASVLKNGRQTQVKEILRRVVGMNGWDGWLGWMDGWDEWLGRIFGMVLCRLGLSAWERDAGTRGFQDFTHA